MIYSRSGSFSSSSSDKSLRRFDTIAAPAFSMKPTKPNQKPHTVVRVSDRRGSFLSVFSSKSGKQLHVVGAEESPEDFVDWSSTGVHYNGCRHSLDLVPITSNVPSSSSSDCSSSLSSVSLKRRLVRKIVRSTHPVAAGRRMLLD